jgi:hypothetical protein
MVSIRETSRDARPRYVTIFRIQVPTLTRLIDSAYFYDNMSVYKDFGGTVLAKDEGMKLAKALGPKNKCLILQNHGSVLNFTSSLELLSKIAITVS